jgi:type I restriction enzyme S subunit
MQVWSNTTVQTTLNLKEIRQLPIPWPPSEVRERIASTVGALDDKIELNRRMNETLEAMARALFKSWFVDFDPVRAKAEGRAPAGMDAATAALFPDGFEESELVEIPRGWQARALYDCATWVNGAAYRDFEFCAPDRGLPIIKIAELKAGITSQTRFTLTNPGDKYLIDTGDVLFSWSGNPDTSIDTFVWARGKGWLNQHIFKVITGSRHDRTFVLWLLRHLRPAFAEIARNKQTTGLGHVTAGDMKRLQVAVPPLSMLAAFDAVVGPLSDLMHTCEVESLTLARLRDALLPKLLSGELRVRDAEKAVEQVA